MTNTTMMTTHSFQMLMTQQVEYISEMKKLVDTIVQSVNRITRDASFADVLEHEIKEIAPEIGCPDAIWTNPATGRKATSVFLAFSALGFWHSRFHVVRNAAKSLPSHHERYDLKTIQRRWSRGWPTPCIDLDDVEALILSTAPIKGYTAIRSFKIQHGIKG